MFNEKYDHKLGEFSNTTGTERVIVHNHIFLHSQNIISVITCTVWDLDCYKFYITSKDTDYQTETNFLNWLKRLQ